MLRLHARLFEYSLPPDDVSSQEDTPPPSPFDHHLRSFPEAALPFAVAALGVGRAQATPRGPAAGMGCWRDVVGAEGWV